MILGVKSLKNIKIGKITLSFIFISLGIVMFLDKFSHYKLIDSLSMLWPTIIIVFGVEVIYRAFSKKRDKDQKTEVGILSTLFIVLFVITTFSLTILTPQYPSIKKAINSRLQYKHKDDISEEVILNKNKKLVINDSNVDIIINKSDEKDIKINLDGVYRHNQERGFRKDFKFINVDNNMGIVKVSKNIKNRHENIKKIKIEELKYSVSLPKDIDIEIINQYGDVFLDLKENNNNVDINCLSGDVYIKLSDNSIGKFNIVATYGNIYDELGFTIIESASTSSINEIRKSLKPYINVRTNNGDVIIRN